MYSVVTIRFLGGYSTNVIRSTTSFCIHVLSRLLTKIRIYCYTLKFFVFSLRISQSLLEYDLISSLWSDVCESSLRNPGLGVLRPSCLLTFNIVGSSVVFQVFRTKTFVTVILPSSVVIQDLFIFVFVLSTGLYPKEKPSMVFFFFFIYTSVKPLGKFGLSYLRFPYNYTSLCCIYIMFLKSLRYIFICYWFND